MVGTNFGRISGEIEPSIYYNPLNLLTLPYKIVPSGSFFKFNVRNTWKSLGFNHNPRTRPIRRDN